MRARCGSAVVAASLALAGLPGAAPAAAAEPRRPAAPLGQAIAREAEPNGTVATANALPGTNLVVRGNISPAADVDHYSFSASAGDRVYVATMTQFSPINDDSQVTLLGPDGVTVLELDDNDGSFPGFSSSVAGASIPATGTYFLKVNDANTNSAEVPYELHLRVRSGSPAPEVEPNNTSATANPLPAGGWVSGRRDPAGDSEQDWFRLTLNAGDTVYLALDLDPERDGVSWDGRLGFAFFGDAGNQVLVADDDGLPEAPAPTIPSEALFMTVKAAGTYYVLVDSASAAAGGPAATYHLSVSVHAATDEGVDCTTYASTDVPKALGPGTGLFSSTLTVPGHPRIADLDVTVALDHGLMQDLDAHLRSPAGNDNGLFSDIGAGAPGDQVQMDTTFDDEAGLPPAFTALRGTQVKPEGSYRLSWFDGEDAGGTWTLDLRDDSAGNGGTLTGWSLRVCEAPPPAPPTCPAGFTPTTVFSTDFESGPAGFTHSGSLDEWELGTPATLPTSTVPPVAAFTTCSSGTRCWKTDLAGTYELSSSQDLISPAINLSGLMPPVVVSWAQRYQLEAAADVFDHVFVDYRQVGGATPVRLFEYLDVTMADAVGSPTVNIGASSGWSRLTRRADSLAGRNTELRFHLDSDTTFNFGGLAIDDVSVTACRLISADLLLTKTDGTATAVPGASTTYTITASNPGLDPVVGATVTDAFPASVTCNWTCVGAGGGTCRASASGNINDTVNLPVGASVTYTASCAIAPGATGTLSNTATVSGGLPDPNPGNNSATDTDTLTPQADLLMTKTDGRTGVQAGEPIAYTIVASNPGPSHVFGARVTDTVPAGLGGASWTCAPAGGGACTHGGTGSIDDTVDLPVGASVTYTLTGTVLASGGPVLSNTATVATPGGVADPVTGNNSATDTDTVVGLRFHTLQPCRIMDTRGGAPIGGPSLQGGEVRTFTVTGLCGVPATAKAVFVDMVATRATAPGNIRLFAGGEPVPPTSSINYIPGRARANNGFVSLNPAGQMSAFASQAAGTTVDLVLDVYGYLD